tara:strand:- start:3017 stop:3319 length:303 start_codon:yes stop_codon:yes gene_type:complete
MSDFRAIPQAISHKKLTKFLTNAQKEVSGENSKLDNYENKEFKELAAKWSIISKEVLCDLERKKSYLTKGKSPNSLMALGAMEVHLNMAIQALKAAEKDD